MHAHVGSIRCETGPGGIGTQFAIELPPRLSNISKQTMSLSRVILILVLFLAGILNAQEQIPKFEDVVAVTIVNLYTSVRDSKGRPVYGLKQEDLTLFINGKRQTITNFSADITEPLNIVFLLDVSGSMGMRGKFDTARSFIRAVIEKLSPEDQVALMIFADGEVEMLVEFTKDKTKLVDRAELLKAYGGTALRDAVAYCHRLLIHNVGKKGVLLLSDGVDNNSDLTLKEAMNVASKVELPIYTFELIRSNWIEEDRDNQDIDEFPLKAFAEATGGLYFTVDEASSENISKACAKIFEDLKYQYYIGYMPKDSKSSYGKVELKTKDEEQSQS